MVWGSGLLECWNTGMLGLRHNSNSQSTMRCRFGKNTFAPALQRKPQPVANALDSKGQASHAPGGFILIAVLWVAMLLSIFALNYATTARLGAVRVQTGERLANQAHALHSALAVAEHKVLKYLANKERLEELANFPDEDTALQVQEAMFPPRHEPYLLEIDDHQVQVRILTETGRWNVNSLNAPMLETVLAACGLEYGANTASVANSILDWIDEDDLRRMDGAESPYYLALEHPYPAKNGPVESIEELLLIRGIDADLFWGTQEHPGLIDFLTVSGQAEKIDINTASPRTLALIPGIRDETVTGVMRRRQEGRIEKMSDLALDVDARDYEQLTRFFDVFQPSGLILEARVIDPDTGRAGRALVRRLDAGS